MVQAILGTQCSESNCQGIAATLSITTLSITILSTKTLSIKTLSITTLSITALSITTLSITTFSIIDIGKNDNQQPSTIILSVVFNVLLS
jgi:hypothetical protein